MGQMEKQMSRAVLNHTDLLSGFNEQLQSLPCLEDALRLLDGPKDAHYDDDSAPAIAEATETVPSANRVLGSTLTHERPIRPMHRIQPGA
jgi:hypothetical protein